MADLREAKTSRVYFKGLNGLRAVAALGVLVAHALQELRSFGFAPRVTQLGSFVTVFFTLSGFLITYLLLEEKQEFARVHLRSFYARRILRIWPLYFAYIALSLIANRLIFGNSIQYPAYIVLYILFLPNIAFNLDRHPADIAHLWSIGIEEQFYAFWPLVVAKVQRLARWLIVFIVMLVCARLALKLLSIELHNKLPFSIAVCMRFDCMATGALFALAYRRSTPWLLRAAKSVVAPLAFWLIVALLATNRFHFFSIFGENVVSVATALFIIHEIERVAPRTYMENPVMSYLGKISFGLYVYHPLVLSLMEFALDRSGKTLSSPFLVVATTLFATTAVSALSYRYLEAWFLRRKESFALVKSGMTPSSGT